MGQWHELLEAVNDPAPILRASDPVLLLRKILSALADRSDLSKAAVKQFEGLVKRNSQFLSFKYDGKSFEWKMKAGKSEGFKDGRLIRQAEDFLVHEELSRLKRCEGEGCLILFVDESKNQSRRWCSMEHCGMLVKSKRYYDTHRRRK